MISSTKILIYFSTHSSVVISQTQVTCDKVQFEHQEGKYENKKNIMHYEIFLGYFHVEKPTKDILNFEELCQAKSLIYTDDTGKKFCFGKPELRKPEDRLTTGKCGALPPGGEGNSRAKLE